MMAASAEVGFFCAIGPETPRALCLVVADVGPVWLPRSVVHVEKLQQREQGWSHRVYLPRALAMERRELVHVLARDVCGPPKYPQRTLSLRPRTAPEGDSHTSGQLATTLYVERRMAHLPLPVAAECLGLEPDEYAGLEAGRTTLANAEDLPRVLSAFQAERERRHTFWRKATGRPFPLPQRGR